MSDQCTCYPTTTILCDYCEANICERCTETPDLCTCPDDGAPATQSEVTSPAYYNTDCWCEERPVRDCPVHGPCFCGSPKCEACAP